MILAAKRILITGASEGFGYAVAQRCLAEGASVAVCARTPERIERAAASLRAAARGDQRVIATVVDVSNPQQVKDLVASTVRELGGLDGLVNNAGIYGPKGLVEEHLLVRDHGTRRQAAHRGSRRQLRGRAPQLLQDEARHGPPETTIWEYPGEDNSWRDEFEAFAHAIAARQPAPVTLRDATRR